VPGCKADRFACDQPRPPGIASRQRHLTNQPFALLFLRHTRGGLIGAPLFIQRRRRRPRLRRGRLHPLQPSNTFDQGRLASMPIYRVFLPCSSPRDDTPDGGGVTAVDLLNSVEHQRRSLSARQCLSIRANERRSAAPTADRRPEVVPQSACAEK
jgi:hypothetical protein